MPAEKYLRASSVLLQFRHSSGCTLASHSISLMINDVEHFCHTLFPLAYPFFPRCLFLVDTQELFRYSGAKSDVCIIHIFSHSKVLLHSLKGIFSEQKSLF